MGVIVVFLTLPAFGYLRFLALFGLGPGVVGFWSFHREITRYIKLILIITALSVVGYIPWDLIAIRDKVWYFIDYLNIWFLGIPLEEYLITILFVFIAGGLTVVFKTHKEGHVRTS